MYSPAYDDDVDRDHLNKAAEDEAEENEDRQREQLAIEVHVRMMVNEFGCYLTSMHDLFQSQQNGCSHPAPIVSSPWKALCPRMLWSDAISSFMYYFYYHHHRRYAREFRDNAIALLHSRAEQVLLKPLAVFFKE